MKNVFCAVLTTETIPHASFGKCLINDRSFQRSRLGCGDFATKPGVPDLPRLQVRPRPAEASTDQEPRLQGFLLARMST